MGVNQGKKPTKTPVSFAILDNHHLTEHGVRHFCARSKQFALITSNKNHPAFRVQADNLHILYQDAMDLLWALEQLKERFGCERLTIQTGGTINSLLLHEKLLDYVDLVMAPVLVGGRNTSTVIDGKSLQAVDELKGTSKNCPFAF